MNCTSLPNKSLKIPQSGLLCFGHPLLLGVNQVSSLKNRPGLRIGILFDTCDAMESSHYERPLKTYHLEFNKKQCDFHAVLAFYTLLGIGIIMNSFLIVVNIFLNKLFLN